MIAGTLSKKWPAQSVCLFCGLRAKKAIRLSSRGVHSSQKTLYESAAAQVKPQVSEPIDIYSTQSSETENVQGSEAVQDSGSLYGARYAGRKSPSWKTNPIAQQKPLNESAIQFSPQGSLQASRQDLGAERHPGSRPQKAQRTVPIRKFVARDPIDKGNGQADGKTESFRIYRRELTGKSRRNGIAERTFRPIDAANLPAGAGRERFSSTDVDTQHSQSFVRPAGFEKAPNETTRTEFNYEESIKNSPDEEGKKEDSSARSSARREVARVGILPSEAEDMPRWTKLPRKTQTPAEFGPPKAEAGAEEIERFQTFRPKRRPSDLLFDNSVPKGDLTDFPQTSTAEKEQARNSNTEYVGFRNSKPALGLGAEVKMAFESSRAKTSPQVDSLSQESDSRDKSKGRRRTSVPEVKEARDARNSKPRYNRSSKDLKVDKDAGLDPEKLERIESRQRKKAERKAARDERASGQVFVVPSFISVGNLASSLKIRAEAFSGVLRTQGFSDLSNDHILDAETAGLIAGELGFKAVLPAKISETDLIAQPSPKDADLLPPRPPIVTIMGHVDHGKTTLLDWLRNSSVAASEHGGITQHIGAFTVQMPSGRIITFLDTPGHAAFLEMRARGANVTDIVILVVAADDSVMPQTIEAIKHAKAAKTQVVVAISKIDKPEADADRVKQDLARNGIEVEDYGGDTQAVCVSGKTGQGMDQLEDAIVALADVLDVKADTTGIVEGWILEAAQKLSGKTATVLVRRGTLKAGQVIVAGSTWARVRNLRNEAGIIIGEALPGTPVEVDGWDQQPEAGAEVLQAPNEQKARRVVDYRKGQAQIEQQMAEVAVLNEARKAHDEKRAREKTRAAAIAAGEKVLDEEVVETSSKSIEVPLIIRADVSGSIEAVNASVLALGNAEIRCSVMRSAVGNVSKTDIEHAAAVKGHIVNFNLPIDIDIMRLAEQSEVKIVDGNIIYRITDDVKSLLEDYLSPSITSHVTGEAEILQIFEINLKSKKTLSVAGCKIRNGTILRGSKVRVIRNERMIYEGILSTLKNVKKDVAEMRKGSECGLSFDDFQAFAVGDQVQCYETKSQKRRL